MEHNGLLYPAYILNIAAYIIAINQWTSHCIVKVIVFWISNASDMKKGSGVQTIYILKHNACMTFLVLEPVD